MLNFRNSDERTLQAEIESFVRDLHGEELTFALLRLMDEKNLTAPQVYHRAELDRKLFNKLIQVRHPRRTSKQTLLQICIGLQTTEEECEMLLGTCGYALELTQNVDRAFLFCIRKKHYKMYQVEEVLDMLEQNSASQNTK